MLHPLPPRPSTSFSQPEPGTSSQPPATLLAPQTPGFCPICPSLPTPQISQPTKYTCPRCSIRTCSLPCSSLHKSLHNCSGERDKGKYIKMNEYGYGAMMDDYVYLEEVGRRVKDWGGQIVKGGFDQNASDRKGKGKATATAMRGGRHVRGSGKSKRDILKLQLEARNIYIELLPAGMEKRNLNQSRWDFKAQTAFMTLQVILHPPYNPLAPAQSPVTLLFHQTDISVPLGTLIDQELEAQLKKTSKSPSRDVLPDWVHELVPPRDLSDSNPPTPPLYLIRVPHPTKVASGKRGRCYRSLVPTEPLLTSLCNIPFVEFPTILIVDSDCVSEGTFEGSILTLDSNAADTEYEYQPPPGRSPKRRKVTRTGKKIMTGLLGGYGSGSDQDEDGNGESHDKDKSALQGLGGYDSSSSEEAMLQVGGDSDEEGSEIATDPSALQELVKMAMAAAAGENDDEELDWDDSDQE